jgi:CheY-like chemotaxis protein
LFRILLVDDMASDRKLLRDALEHRGAQVTEAATDVDAYEALAAANRQDFDLLLTDINLGVGTTGFDVARAARRAIPDLPIVYMTAHDIDMEAHALEGALCLHKPMRILGLADQVLDYAAARRAHGGRVASEDDGALTA